MAKLRKMLGRADDPQIVTLMHLIETQSKPTLAAWAAACVQERYLPVYERAYPDDRRLRELIEAIGAQAAAAQNTAAAGACGPAGGGGRSRRAGRGPGSRDRLRRYPNADQRTGLCVLRRSGSGIRCAGPVRSGRRL